MARGLGAQARSDKIHACKMDAVTVVPSNFTAVRHGAINVCLTIALYTVRTRSLLKRTGEGQLMHGSLRTL